MALVAGALVAAPQIVAPTPASAAPGTVISPSSPMKMERFTFSASQPTRFARSVALQARVGSSWRTVATGRTAASGAFRFTVHTGSVTTLRGYSPAVKYRGRAYGRIGTSPVTVRPLDQSVSLSVAAASGSASATVVTRPARNGRSVTVQRANGSSWKTMATGKVNAQGKAVLHIAATSAGARYRAVTGAWNGAPGRASAPVSPPPPPVASAVALSPAAPISMERFSFSSGVPTKFARPVVLQAKAGSSWRTVSSARTAATGRFSFTVHTGSVTTLRAVAAATSYRGISYPQVVTSSVTVRPLGQSVGLSMVKEASVNEAVAAQITASPVRAGRKVDLQVLAGSKWTTLSTAAAPASGPLTMKFTAAAEGAFSYRAVAEPWNGASSAASAPSKVVIDADEVKVADTARPLTQAESDSIRSFEPSTGTIAMTAPPSSASTIKDGDIVVVPPRDDAPSGALVKVTKVTTSGGTTTLSTTPADLPDVVTNVPDDATDVGMTVTSTTFIPADGVTQDTGSTVAPRLAPRARGITPMAISPLKLNVDQSMSINRDGMAFETSNKGTIEISPAVDLSLDMDHGSLKGYRIGSGYQIDEELTTSDTLKYSKSSDLAPEQKVKLGDLKWESVGFLGGIPVYVHYEASLFIRITFSGEVSIEAKTTQTGRSIAGITQTSGTDMTPKGYSSYATTQNKVTRLTAEGSVKIDAGMSGELSLYGVGGPYGELGAEVGGKFSISTDGARSCEFSMGPYAEFGLKTGDLIKKLTKLDLKASVKYTPQFETSNICPASANPPQITTSSLSDATVGKPYNGSLQVSGGNPPYVWSATGLPAGLSLDQTTGTILGTPTTSGNASVTVSVRDADKAMATRTFPLTVKASGATPPDGSEYVTIPDKKFLDCVDDALGLDSGARVSAAQAAGLQGLTCNNMSITSLEGIQWFSNLTSVQFYNDDLTDIDPLGALAKLSTINLEQNKISDISALAKLKNVTSLDLWINDVSDISALAGMKSLTYLDFRDNKISDISSLSGLTKVTHLALEGNMISDLRPISRLTAIDTLWLGGNKIEDLTPIAGLVNVDQLYLEGNQISSLVPLSGLTKLNELNLGLNSLGNNVSDLAPLITLKNLRTLYIANNDISDLSSLTNLKSLRELYLGSNQISDLRPLSAMTSLRRLSLNWNEVSDLAPLASLTSLWELDVSGNPVRSLSPVSSLINLQILDAHDALVSDVSPLSGLVQLRELDFGNDTWTTYSNTISDLTPLQGLTNLTSLKLWDNRVTNVSPLKGLTNLTELLLGGNPVCSAEPDTRGCDR